MRARSSGRSADRPPGAVSAWRWGTLGVLLALGVGEAVGRSGLVDPTFVPPTSVVLARMAALLGDPAFLADLAATVRAWLLSLAGAALVGVALGLLLGGVRAAEQALRLPVEFARSIAPTAIVPLVMLLVPDDTAGKVLVASFAGLWPVAFNTLYAVRDTDPLALQTARVFGFGRLAVLTRVVLPSAAPFVATGVRIAATVTLLVVIASELFSGARHGIGVFILRGQESLSSMPDVIAGAGFAALLGFLGNGLVELVERRLVRWHFQRGGPARA
jgi:NitT/TauT family transport system permease protein